MLSAIDPRTRIGQTHITVKELKRGQMIRFITITNNDLRR